jgi:hypothetical protein
LYRNDYTAVLDRHGGSCRDVVLGSASKDVYFCLKRFFDFVVGFLDRFCDLPDLVV